mmetsp:Transcript_16187/g.35729  ORF Transcript_16187/g.35729 Transcript_16187/m.35729 type:complete len:176 (+) Transcript_16187:213-740(+)
MRTGHGDKMTPKLGTFFEETPKLTHTDIVNAVNGRKVRCPVLLHDSGLCNNLTHVVPEIIQLSEKLSLNDGDIFKFFPQLCRGSFSVHANSLLSGDYAESTNNRTDDSFKKNFLKDFFELAYSQKNIGDTMYEHLAQGNVKMEEGPEGPFIPPQEQGRGALVPRHQRRGPVASVH